MANVYFDSIRVQSRKERKKNKFLSNRIGVTECMLETIVNYLESTVNLTVDPDIFGNDEDGIPYFIFSEFYQDHDRKYNDYDYDEREKDMSLELFHIIESVCKAYINDDEIKVNDTVIHEKDSIYGRIE